MKSIKKSALVTGVVGLIFTLGACADMSARDKSTVAGAAIGGVAGSVLSSGSGLGTVGGAAVGGVIGNQVGKGR